MKKKSVRGTVWNPFGQRNGKHDIIDPMPENASSGDELLEKFLSNLVEIYRKIAPRQPVDAHRYVVQQLSRLQKFDPETKQPSPPEEQKEFQEKLLTMFKRLAGLLKEIEDSKGD